MAYKFLYYPTITIPDETWLRRVLLYSDKLGTIAPVDARQNLGRPMDMLREQEELEYLAPENAMHQIEDALHEEVEDIVTAPDYEDQSRRHLIGRKTMEIHQDKLTGYMVNLFHNLGLMSKVRDRLGYYEIDYALGTTYLGALAKHMGRVHGFTPCTGESEYERLLFNVTATSELHPIASVRLRRLLPTPTDDTPLGDIMWFKRQHRRELLNLRRRLRSFERDLKEAPSADAATTVIEQFEEDIELEKHRIGTLLTDTGINFVMSSVKYLLDIKPTGLGVASAVVQIAMSYAKGGRERVTQELNSPFSYVFAVQQAFGRGCCHWGAELPKAFPHIGQRAGIRRRSSLQDIF
ncbi:MAG: hypothetical protein K0R39_3655 [Symbiobacteriaceae bacterium]|nr:hypothetical protein [Symbiobacteriaceae bacterium]